ncbi:cohesin domain-containing protein [Microcystis aeruginosa]|uniref:PEP-CTERM sorting domain-containing protein n=1 Tax=Microcystis aeruginosa 11-30S32 TaxID=2358142 RepID=A0A510PDQ1_MICAE|nr:cohesin domain-containing protein [Microcystis aeruginosa]GCA91898.1 hypothetical protein AUK29_06595 [Microcystis aeruginosa 11-30S32]
MNTKVSLSCALGLLSILNVSSAQAISLGFSPVSQTVIIGQPAQIALKISDLVANSAPSLGSFDLKINFYPSILSFNSVSFGDPILGDQLDLEGLGSTSGFSSLSNSIVNVFEVSVDQPNTLNLLQADSFILATLTFNSLGIGISPLTISNIILGDADGAPLTAALGDGSIIVIPQSSTSVPEPSSLFISVGLLGFCCLKKQ